MKHTKTFERYGKTVRVFEVENKWPHRVYQNSETDFSVYLFIHGDEYHKGDTPSLESAIKLIERMTSGNQI